MFFVKQLFSQQLERLLRPIKNWLDNLEIHDTHLAKLISTLIPASCPFKTDIALFGTTIARIPPLCKLNPFYEQFVFLRFRALGYLSDRDIKKAQPTITVRI